MIENESIFQMYGIESMARDMRHPYIPSTTVLGDIGMGPMPTIVDV